MTASVLVLGGNVGGLTAALTIKRELGDDVDVTVVSDRAHFLFSPSLIWVPFGKRTGKDITFDLERTYTDHGVHFVVDAATRIDPEAGTVTSASGTVRPYDYLVVSTGTRNAPELVDGLADNASTITTLETALAAREAWDDFTQVGGDVVVGAAPGASCFGAAYEFLFNTAYQLKKAGMKGRSRLTYVTAEPFLGHFGIGGLPHGEQLLGMFLRKEGIEARTDVAIDHVDDGAVVLADGDKLPFGFSMIVPAFRGQDFLAGTPGLTNAAGFIEVRDTYQTTRWDTVYAVGLAAAVPVPWTTATPVGIPKTGFPTEQQAVVAAHNIASQVRGEAPSRTKRFADIPAFCIMDAGNNGVLILADHMLPPREHGVLVPGPQNHAAKLAFEKYYMWKMRGGHVALP